MNLLRSVITLYEEVFKNDASDTIFLKFNAKEKIAMQLILENTLLEDSQVKNKLAQQIYHSKPDNPN